MKGMWHEWEERIMAAEYPSGGTAGCAKALPHRTERAIRSRALAMKLRRATARDSWTAVEDSLIFKLYPDGGAAAVAEFTPNRSLPAICQRACRLKVFHTASPFCKPGADEILVPIPTHDYCDTHRAWQSTRLPVYATGFGAAVIASGVAL